jgi:hypothetical protein
VGAGISSPVTSATGILPTVLDDYGFDLGGFLAARLSHLTAE